MKHLAMQVEFANGASFTQAAPDEVVFQNEINVDAEGWAMLAPWGDFKGMAQEMANDGTVKTYPGIQRVDRAAGEAMASQFKSFWGKVGRGFKTGIDIFNGHPDAMTGGEKYPDKESKGMIVDVEAGEGGLLGKPIFNNEGAALLKSRKLCFSTRWSTQYVGEENGAKVFRPDKLKSVGLVASSALPVEYLNSSQAAGCSPLQPPASSLISAPADAGAITKPNITTNIMEKTKLIALLQKLGVEMNNEATDEQIETAIGGLQRPPEGGTTGNTVDISKQLEEAKTQFANERQERVKEALDGAVTDGKITEAQRGDWEKKLTADFANALPELRELTPAIKTKSVTIEMGGRKVEMANASDRREFINKAIEQVAAELKLDRVAQYDQVFAEVEKRYPQIFGVMNRPGVKKF